MTIVSCINVAVYQLCSLLRTWEELTVYVRKLSVIVNGQTMTSAGFGDTNKQALLSFALLNAIIFIYYCRLRYLYK